MEEKTLLLEGLPSDFKGLRTKLELYFKNRRKSGGEVVEIREDPEDKRKALLIYLLDTDVSNVLRRGKHKIQFKPEEIVELTVKRKEEKSNLENPTNISTEMVSTDVQPNAKVAEIHKGNKMDSKNKHLLISSMEQVDKNILTMYFEQYTEKAEITNHGKNKWILKVASHLDAEIILKLKNHEFGLKVVSYEESDSADQWDPRRFVLTGFKDHCKCKLISMFIGSCSQRPEHTWEVIDERKIVVTFKESIDSKSFLDKCAAKDLQGMEIKASCLKFTDSVLVQGDMSKITEDILILYFSNNKRSGGGEIKSLIWVHQQNSVVISFQDCHAAQEVVERKHHICGTDLNTLLFYSSLQRALTGETFTCSDLPTNVIIPVDEVLLKFIEKSHQCKNDFKTQLKGVYANIIFNNLVSPGGITLEMSLDKESFAAARLGVTWKCKAQSEAQAFLSRYSTAEFPVEVEIWKSIEHDCLGFVTSDTLVTYLESESKIAVAGLKTDVKMMSEKIQNLCKDAAVELQKQRDTVEKVIQFDSKQALELVGKCVNDKLHNVTLTKNKNDLTFHLRGLRACVETAEMIIKQAQENVIFRPLNLSGNLIDFLKSFDIVKFEQNHFDTSQITALFLDNRENLEIVAEKRHLEAAEDKVKEILCEEVIKLTADVNTAINSEDLVNFLNKIKLEVGINLQNVNVIHSEAQIVICGYTRLVKSLSEKVKNYLENNIPATKYIHLKSLQEMGFVDSCMKLSDIPEIRKLGITVQSCKTMKSQSLKVTASKEKIQDALTVIEKHLSTICTEKHPYSKAGESKAILKHKANIQAKAKEWGCMACISTLKTHPLKRYSYQINSSIALTVTEGDLQHFPADALVCPMSSKLAFDNPVAQKFLQVAGSDIQGVCNRLQKEKQTLPVGEVFLSNPGNLKTNSLIYTILPQKGQQLTQSCHYLKSAILNSLQKAESRNATSIAMPMQGCDRFGFSVKESCMAIREAVLQSCNNQPKSLKNINHIYVIDSDVKRLEEFNNIIAQMGFSNVTASTRVTSRGQTNFQTSNQASDTEVTVHGVLVSLKNGDITKETVDIIVNSNNKNLNLDTGVSGAIFKAAGQSIVEECKQHGKLQHNEVVLTSGGNLSCKHIAQMVGPNNAADITYTVENVLKLCETTAAATVAIPAIGTGRGGIVANDSIWAILAGVENYLTQATSSNLQKINVVAFQQKIYDAYRDHFKNRNNKITSTKHNANKVKIASVWIELKKGNIVNESVRGIVNTTNSEMNLMGGVSGDIFKAAGPSVQQECTTHGPLKTDTVAVTSAGNLQCNFIVHMMGPHSSADASLRVRKVLESCEEKQISTVSFPAIGTGRGHLNGLDAIAAMLQGFNDHLSQCSSSVLKLIYIIIDQDEVLKQFQQGLNQWTAKSQDCTDTEEFEEESCSYGDDDDDDDYYDEEEEQEEEQEQEDLGETITETTVGPIQVKMLCGDITRETTDSIVNSTNTSLNLNYGVSGAILKAAGQAVTDECKKLGVQPNNGVVLTTAGNLPFKHIVHMVGQTKEKEITNCMYKVLKKCEEHQIKSVSFPALGTGAGNLAASCVANAMMDALANFSIDSPVYLKTVHIVIFQPRMLPDFKDALRKFKRNSGKPFAVTTPNQAAQTSVSTTQTFSFSAELAAVTFPVTTVEIYGTSSLDMAKVKKFLDNLISEESFSKEVQSNYINNLSQADNKVIVKLSKSNQVHILMASRDKLMVSGQKEDVLDTVLEINKFIQAAQDQGSKENEKRRLSKILHWDVAAGEIWKPLSSTVSYEIELAFHRKEKTFSYKEKGETFTVNFSDMKRVNTKGESCKVKRTLLADSDTAVIQPPPTWTKMHGNDLEIVLLSKDSEEYKKLECDFLHSSKHNDIAPVQVVEIQRIQSQSQWQRYCVLKQAVDKKYPKQKNEQFLYHGTTKEICQKINKNGFNRSFCGRNAVVHGEGTYFARDAWYSCYDQYSNPDDQGIKYIYKARVVTGSQCKSQNGMKEPDPLDPNNPHAGLHDCAVDNLQNPFIFVVFCDAGAYPDYLISFKNV